MSEYLTKKQKNQVFEALSRNASDSSSDEDIISIVHEVVGDRTVTVSGSSRKNIVIGDGNGTFNVTFLCGAKEQEEGSLLLG